MNRKEHWEQVYETKAVDSVSWYQTTPLLSLELIADAGEIAEQGIIDVGGGASVLVDHLLEKGYRDLSVLDLSGAALEAARERLGDRAESVTWIETDVTTFEPARRFGVWHDRAVFHFLTDATDRRRYVEAMRRSLVDDGCVIIATFALDGPAKCSGLDVVRYDAAGIAEELGAGFRLVDERRETHVTPSGSEQRFIYARFVRIESDRARADR